MTLSFGSYAVENPLAKIRGRSGVGLGSIKLVPLAGLVTLGSQTLTREGQDSSSSAENQSAEIYKSSCDTRRKCRVPGFKDVMLRRA